MYEVNSQTITKEYKEANAPSTLKEWKFQIPNGNDGEMTISDSFIETEAIATERAKSEFLKNSYKQNEVRFSTYRTDMSKNDTISISGIPYIVKGIITTISATSIKTQIRGARYE